MFDTSALLHDLLETFVLEYAPSGRWSTLGPLPEWSSFLLGTCDEDNRDLSEEHFSPFLAHFCEDARDAWLNAACPVDSGIWVEPGGDGEEIYFRARVDRWRGRNVLLISKLSEETARRNGLLQLARENLLTSEQLEAEVLRRTAQIRDREEQIAIRLLAAAGTRDVETGSHLKRIGLYAEAMGKALGWRSTEVTDLRIAAPMHDIGKIGIPDSILCKPGKLSARERAIMEQHTEIGARMLEGSDIPLLEMAAEIARHHHEKYGGGGYPRGITGDAIPITARIVTVVDIYDALVHKRVYKPAIEESQVIDMMRDMAPQHLDPNLLSVFVANLAEMREIRHAHPDADPIAVAVTS